jgi:integrase
MAILVQCLGEAADRYGFPSPAATVKRPKSPRTEIAPFSLPEIDLLCREIRGDLRPYLLTRFFTGLRTGEINGLKWDHVDLGAGLIRVRDTYSAGVDEPRTKTEYSQRDIPILPPVRDALLVQWREGLRRCPYVFHSRRGLPIDAHNFANRIWYPLLKRLGLAKRRPYQTRHTTATLLLASGESPEWIARFMGHASTQMLFTVYSRYVPNLTRQDGSAIGRVLQGWQPPASPRSKCSAWEKEENL